jgi:hypothetical protein
MRWQLAIVTGALAVVPLPVLADTAPVALTGPLAAAVEQSAAGPGIDADEAAGILGVILAGSSADPSTAVSPEEGALLQALAQARAPFTVTVDGRALTVGPLQPDAARFMDLVFRGSPDIPAALEAGNTEALLHLARCYGLPQQLLMNQSRALMAEDLMKAWRNSSYGNSYQPLRDKLRIATLLYEAAPPATAKAGRRLLYSAMDTVDRNANGSVPDFLYQYLKN